MLKLENIRKTFHAGTVNQKIALDGLSLTLNDGDFVTVIGGNGAGKSTLLNTIAGTFPVDSGSITIDGEDITDLPEQKRARFLGRVFQDPMMGTAADMWIEENMALAAHRGERRGLRWAISPAERENLRRLLSELDLGLEDRLSSKVGLLSGGQRQALTLLMAVMKKPKLLLLDEHTAALDPKTAAKVLALSDRFIEESRLTALMVTHNMKDAIAHGNRLIMMNAGKIVFDISGEEKKRLTVDDLLHAFTLSTAEEFANDRILLSCNLLFSSLFSLETPCVFFAQGVFPFRNGFPCQKCPRFLPAQRAPLRYGGQTLRCASGSPQPLRGARCSRNFHLTIFSPSPIIILKYLYKIFYIFLSSQGGICPWRPSSVSPAFTAACGLSSTAACCAAPVGSPPPMPSPPMSSTCWSVPPSPSLPVRWAFPSPVPPIASMNWRKRGS